MHTFLFSNFRRFLNVVCFLLGNSPASEFYIPTFQNTLFHLYRRIGRFENVGIFIREKVWLEPNLFFIINTETYPNLVIFYTYPPIKLEQSVPKRRNIKFRRRGITQNKAYNNAHLHYSRHLLSNFLLRHVSAPKEPPSISSTGILPHQDQQNVYQM